MLFSLLVLAASQSLLDPPVTMEKSIHLNDDNNDTCLVLAQTDMYTWSAGAQRWFPERRGKCFHRGLSISRCVPEAIQASFTVTITGRHLVCSNFNVNVLIGKTNWSQCETSGVYRKCTLSGNTESGSNSLTTCVAKCICNGKDCKHVSIRISTLQKRWQICEIHIQ